jgi:hypothetical protein
MASAAATGAINRPPIRRPNSPKKAKRAKLCYSLNHLMENRRGLLVDTRIAIVTGAGRALGNVGMLSDLMPCQRLTVRGDKGFDTAGFVEGCRELG